MNFKRILANAFARRIAYVIVAALLAWLGVDKAHAAYPTVTCTAGKNPKCTEGQAYSECVASGTNWVNSDYTGYFDKRFKECYKSNTAGTIAAYRARIELKQDSNSSWSLAVAPQEHWYALATSCTTTQTYTGNVNVTLRPEMKTCWNGCSHQGIASAIDDTFVVSGDPSMKPGQWVHTTFQGLGTPCVENDDPEKPECTAGQKRLPDGTCGDQADCPVGQHKVNDVCEPDGVCPTGKVKAPDGSCVEDSCPAGRAKGKDGTCKPDANNDGVPDAEEDGNEDGDKFSGGDNCNSPPACSGSPILCGQARIQWRIDCNTRRNETITGGACATMPICTGEKCNAVEYSQLLMQWRTACALEKGLAQGGSGETGIKDHMTALKQAEVNALRALGTDDGHGDVNPEDMWDTEEGETPNQGLLGGGGGQCDFGFQIRGKNITISQQGWTIVAFIRWLFIAGAYLWVAARLGR